MPVAGVFCCDSKEWNRAGTVLEPRTPSHNLSLCFLLNHFCCNLRRACPAQDGGLTEERNRNRVVRAGSGGGFIGIGVRSAGTERREIG